MKNRSDFIAGARRGDMADIDDANPSKMADRIGRFAEAALSDSHLAGKFRARTNVSCLNCLKASPAR